MRFLAVPSSAWRRPRRARQGQTALAPWSHRRRCTPRRGLVRWQLHNKRLAGALLRSGLTACVGAVSVASLRRQRLNFRAQPHPHTGAWVYIKHRGWCYRAFSSAAAASAAGPAEEGVHKAATNVPVTTAYKLAHSPGWASTIAASESAAHTSNSRTKRLARLGQGASGPRALLAAGKRPAGGGAQLADAYAAAAGVRVQPAGGGDKASASSSSRVRRPKGRLPAALRGGLPPS